MQQSTSSRRSVQIALLVAAAFFMENLDGTVIVTALPQMAQSFGTDAVNLNIGMTAYMLTLAVFIPISGWMADRFGPRAVFSSAIAIFTAASVLCATSHGLASFTTYRVLQGFGGAMMVPVGRLVVLRTTEKKHLLRSMAYITWPGLVAPILGPPVGGLITTHFSWPWVFYLNVPLGVIGIALALILLDKGRDGGRRPLDILGFVLSAGACTSFVYGLELASRVPTPIGQATGFVVGGLLLGWASVWHLRRQPNPLIDFAALKLPSFAIAIFGGSLFRMGISAAPFLLPLMFQVGFGLSPVTSGTLVLAVFAGNLAMKSVVTTTLRRFGFRTVLLVNGVLTAVTLAACGLLSPTSSYILVSIVLFLSGLSRSLQFSAVSTLSFADVPKSEMSSATTLFSVITQLSMGMGVAVGALALRLAGLLDPQTSGAPTLFDFRISFFLVALLSLSAVPECLRLAPDAGTAVSGHTPGRRNQNVVSEAGKSG